MTDIIRIVFSESNLSIIDNAWSIPAGIIIIYVYGRLHFNTPAYPIEMTVSSEASLTDTARLITQAPPIYTTFRQRYNSYALRYIGLLQLAFLVCVFWYSIVKDISRAEDIAIPDLTKESLQYRSVFALFLLIGLLPSFPALKEVDSWLLSSLHRLAYIPDEAKLFAERLYESELKSSPGIMAEVGSGIAARDIARVVSDTASGVLEKRVIDYLCLYIRTQSITRRTRYRGARIQFDRDFVSLANQNQKLRSELTTYFRKQERLVPADVLDIDAFISDNVRKNTFAELLDNRNQLKLKLDVQYKILCIIISLTTIATSKNVEQIDDTFRLFGFEMSMTATLPMLYLGLGHGAKVFWSAALFLALFNIVYFMLGSYFGLFYSFPVMAPTKASIIRFSGTLVFTYPIIVWLTIKLHRRWSRARLVPSVRKNILVAICSYGAAVPINLLVNFYLTGDRPYYAPILLSLNQGVFGYFMGVYMDAPIYEKPLTIRLPLYQGMIQAITTLIVLWFGEILITKGADGEIFRISFYNVAFSMILAGVSGFIFGMLVQYVYAERGDRRERVLVEPAL
jgi:hypothetical protein